MSQLWRHGPEWQKASFVQSEVQRCMPAECTLELKTTQLHSLVSTTPDSSMESLIDPTKFSTLSRLIGATAKVLRAIQKLKNLTREKNDPSANPVDEVAEAELLWMKSAQKELSDLKIQTKRFNLFKNNEECGVVVEGWLTQTFCMQ